MQYATLSNGVELPMIGYGTFMIKDSALCEKCVTDALETGYRLFDTAASYENEAEIGRALRGSGLPREAWFVTTKLWVQDAGYRAMEEAYKAGKLKAIGVCNCYPQILADICETVEVKPAVDQVELHPFFQQEMLWL